MRAKCGHYMGNGFIFKRINIIDNCGSNFPSGINEKGELHQQDCCTHNPIYSPRLCLLNCVVLIDSGCQNGGWSCCSSSNQCSIGEGDCDDDSECSGNLVCGTDNCDSNFQNGTNEQGEFHQQDCCTQATQGNKNNYLV